MCLDLVIQLGVSNACVCVCWGGGGGVSTEAGGMRAFHDAIFFPL